MRFEQSVIGHLPDRHYFKAFSSSPTEIVPIETDPANRTTKVAQKSLVHSRSGQRTNYPTRLKLVGTGAGTNAAAYTTEDPADCRELLPKVVDLMRA
jgi:hypothetical protein